jgi:hypothetical protein
MSSIDEKLNNYKNNQSSAKSWLENNFDEIKEFFDAFSEASADVLRASLADLNSDEIETKRDTDFASVLGFGHSELFLDGKFYED